MADRTEGRAGVISLAEYRRKKAAAPIIEAMIETLRKSRIPPATYLPKLPPEFRPDSIAQQFYANVNRYVPLPTREE